MNTCRKHLSSPRKRPSCVSDTSSFRSLPVPPFWHPSRAEVPSRSTFVASVATTLNTPPRITVSPSRSPAGNSTSASTRTATPTGRPGRTPIRRRRASVGAVTSRRNRPRRARQLRHGRGRLPEPRQQRGGRRARRHVRRPRRGQSRGRRRPARRLLPRRGGRRVLSRPRRSDDTPGAGRNGDQQPAARRDGRRQRRHLEQRGDTHRRDLRRVRTGPGTDSMANYPGHHRGRPRPSS